MEEFITQAKKMDVDLLEIDRFLHEGFYQDLKSLEENLELLTLFIKNRH